MRRSPTAREIIRQLRSESIIWINPSHVRFYVGPNRKREHEVLLKVLKNLGMLRRRNAFERWIRQRLQKPFVIPERRYREAVPLESMRRYIFIKDYLEHYDDVENSIWYKHMRARIQTRGLAQHKKLRITDTGQLQAFFSDYVRPLHDSMVTTGYDTAKAPDTGSCFVSRDGEIHLGNKARHRFIFAKLLQVKSVPLQVFGIHERWFDSRIGAIDIPQIAGELRRLQRELS